MGRDWLSRIIVGNVILDTGSVRSEDTETGEDCQDEGDHSKSNQDATKDGRAGRFLLDGSDVVGVGGPVVWPVDLNNLMLIGGDMGGLGFAIGGSGGIDHGGLVSGVSST